jgi:MerR family transcriptional regulator, repressor of the yfmOP operon
VGTGNKERGAGTYAALHTEAVASAPASEHDYLQIGEVAELTGLTQRALRYYEELQLLDPPTRMAGGFRLYSRADVARLQHIVRLKQLLGFSLAEIKEIVTAEEAQANLEAGSDNAASARRLARIEHLIAGTSAQLDMLARKIAQMEVLRGELAGRLRELESRRAALRIEHEGAQLHAASEYS